MDAIAQLLRSLPDGPVFGRDLAAADGIDAAVDWMRGCGRTRTDVRILGLSQEPEGWLVLDLAPVNPDPRWREVLNTTRGTRLYEVALNWTRAAPGGP
jgi:hypothetical protein